MATAEIINRLATMKPSLRESLWRNFLYAILRSFKMNQLVCRWPQRESFRDRPQDSLILFYSFVLQDLLRFFQDVLLRIFGRIFSGFSRSTWILLAVWKDLLRFIWFWKIFSRFLKDFYDWLGDFCCFSRIFGELIAILKDFLKIFQVFSRFIW